MNRFLTAKLGEVCTITKGVTGLASAKPGIYPLVTTGAERKTHDSFQFDDEAVCIPLVSSTGHGKRTLNYIHYQSGRFAIGTILAAIIPKNKEQLSAAFLHRYLLFYKNQLVVPLMKGAANVSLAVKDIAKIQVPIPPVELQKEFIKYFNRINEAGTAFQQQAELQSILLTKLRQSILQDAIEGKLTAEWRKYNPVKKGNPEFDAEALLEKIKAEKEKLIKEGTIKKQKLLTRIKPEDMPFELPEGWGWTRLGELTLRTEAGTSFLCKDETVEGESWGVIRTSAITSGHFLEEESKFYSDNEPTNIKSRINTNDFLFCRASGSKGLAGRSCIVDKVSKNLLLSDKSIRLTLSEYIDLKLINHINNCEYGEKYRLSLSTNKSTSMNNIQREEMLALPIPLAPIKEQKVILGRIEKLFSLVDELEKRVSERKGQSEQLMQVVLREAFEGKIND